MVKLTDTDALVAARCAAPGWIRWAQSNRDGRVHAFPIEDPQQGRWLRAVCSHTIPPAALSTTGVSIRCARCALTVTAARTARHRALRRGGCARLRAWVLGCVSSNLFRPHSGNEFRPHSPTGSREGKPAPSWTFPCPSWFGSDPSVVSFN